MCTLPLFCTFTGVAVFFHVVTCTLSLPFLHTCCHLLTRACAQPLFLMYVPCSPSSMHKLPSYTLLLSPIHVDACLIPSLLLHCHAHPLLLTLSHVCMCLSSLIAHLPAHSCSHPHTCLLSFLSYASLPSLFLAHLSKLTLPCCSCCSPSFPSPYKPPP